MTGRKQIAVYGRRGALIRVFRETVRGKKMTRVQWRPAPKARLKTQGFPTWSIEAKDAAIAFAEGLAETLGRPAGSVARAFDAPRLTLDQLFERYQLAEFDHLRPLTQRNYRTYWRAWVIFAGPTLEADAVTREHLDRFRRVLTQEGHTANQIQHHFKTLRMVFRWGVEEGAIAPSRVVTYRYKVPKDAKRVETKEFRRDEAERILAQFDPRSSRGWRPYVLTILLAYLGKRQTATRSLSWSDVDFAEGLLVWRGATDKQGELHLQPMHGEVREALWIAYGWRTFDGYTGPFVLYGVQRRRRGEQLHRAGGRVRTSGARVELAEDAAAPRPWDYSAYMKQLDRACNAAEPKVDRAKWQGAHAFRRMVAGDIYEALGEKAAADYIGDKSVKLVQDRYLKRRAEGLRKASNVLPALAAVTVTRGNS